MKVFKYLALGGVFTGLVVSYNGETNLSNTTGISCTSNFIARSVVTDSRNRIHVVWQDEGDTLNEKQLSSSYFTKYRRAFHFAKSYEKTNLKGFKQTPNLYYKRSLDGGTTWQDTVRLADAVGMPSIATNNLDIVHTVWSSDQGIHHKRSINGGGSWENDTLLGVDITSIGPTIATAGDNLAHIIWREDIDDTTYRFLYTQSIDDGANWNTSITIVEVANEIQLDSMTTLLPCPSLSAANNSVHLVWQNSIDDSLGEIYYRRSINGGTTWESAKKLTSDTLFSFFPTVASYGNLVYVGWLEATYTDSFLHYSFIRSSNGGTNWDSPVCLILPEPIDWMFGTPQLVAKDELVAVVWGNATQGGLSICFKYSKDSGANWGGAKYARRIDTSSVYYPSAAIDDSEHIHIVWTDTKDGNEEAYYAKYSMLGVEEETKTTNRLALSVNPNPFSIGTQIRFEVPISSTEVSLRIYNISGELVQTLLKGKKTPGVHTTIWNAEDNNGRRIKNGVYFCKFTTKNRSITEKVILIK